MIRGTASIALFVALAQTGCTQVPEGERTAQRLGPSQSPEPIYALRVPPSRDAVVPLARFEGKYEVHDGCLAFNMNGELYLPALTTEGDAYLRDNQVTIGSRTIELDKRVTPGGSVLDPADLERAVALPPAPCAAWPKIRI